MELDARRRSALRAAPGFLQLPPRAPELRLLHRWLDTWTGLGLVVVGVERQGLRFSLSHIAEERSLWPRWLYRSTTQRWSWRWRSGSEAVA